MKFGNLQNYVERNIQAVSVQVMSTDTLLGTQVVRMDYDVRSLMSEYSVYVVTDAGKLMPIKSWSAEPIGGTHEYVIAAAREQFSGTVTGTLKITIKGLHPNSIPSNVSKDQDTYGVVNNYVKMRENQPNGLLRLDGSGNIDVSRISVENGLMIDAGKIKLGGALTGFTSIEYSDTNALMFTSTDGVSSAGIFLSGVGASNPAFISMNASYGASAGYLFNMDYSGISIYDASDNSERLVVTNAQVRLGGASTRILHLAGVGTRVVTVSADGTLSSGSMSGSPVLDGKNGLTLDTVDSKMKLGGSLDQNTTILTTTYDLIFTGNRASHVMRITNPFTGGKGIDVMTNNVGLVINTAASSAALITTNSDFAAMVLTTNGSTSWEPLDVLQLQAGSTNPIEAGFGAAINVNVQGSAGMGTAARQVFMLSDHLNASYTSQYELYLANLGGGITRKMAVTGAGEMVLDAYTGVGDRNLMVDSTGKLIIGTGGGGLDEAAVRAAISMQNGLTYDPVTGIGKLGGDFTQPTTEFGSTVDSLSYAYGMNLEFWRSDDQLNGIRMFAQNNYNDNNAIGVKAHTIIGTLGVAGPGPAERQVGIFEFETNGIDALGGLRRFYIGGGVGYDNTSSAFDPTSQFILDVSGDIANVTSRHKLHTNGGEHMIDVYSENAGATVIGGIGHHLQSVDGINSFWWDVWNDVDGYILQSPTITPGMYPTRYIPMAVNGNFADQYGNITLSGLSGDNFATANLIATANRSHDFGAYLLNITGSDVGGSNNAWSTNFSTAAGMVMQYDWNNTQYSQTVGLLSDHVYIQAGSATGEGFLRAETTKIGIYTGDSVADKTSGIYANASGVVIGSRNYLDTVDVATSLTIKSLNSATATNVLFYDPATGLVTHGLAPAGGGSGITEAQADTLYFKKGGNTFGMAAALGNNDSNELSFMTNATNRMRIAADGRIAIGGAHVTPAIFNVVSTNLGSIPAPIMTEAERDLIATPMAGLQVFNSTSGKLNYHNGTTWAEVGAGGPANAFVQGGNTFGAIAELGTTDNFALHLKSNNVVVAKASTAEFTVLETLRAVDRTATSAGYYGFSVLANSNQTEVVLRRPTSVASYASDIWTSRLLNNGADFKMQSGSSQRIHLTTGGEIIFNRTTAAEYARFMTGGKFLIGTTTDSGELVQINGTLKVATLNNAVGDFVTTSATGTLQKRTTAEVKGDLGLTNAFVQGGNSFGAMAVIGTLDAQDFLIKTNNQNRLYLNQTSMYYYGNPIYTQSALEFNNGAANQWDLKTNAGTMVRFAGNLVDFQGQKVQANGRGFIATATVAGNYAFQSTVGDNAFNTTSGVTMIGTTTSTGEKFQVAGTARATKFYATAVTASTTVYPVEIMNAAATTWLFRVNELGYLTWGNNTFNTLTPNTLSFSQGSGVQIYTSAANNAAGTQFHIQTANSITLTTADANFTTLKVGAGFAPVTGNASYTDLHVGHIINQTSSASGTVRGIYYNPTLTSVLGAHYAFDAASGGIKVTSLAAPATETHMLTVNDQGVFGKQAMLTGLVTGGASVGASGYEVYAGKNGANLEFKKIAQGANITISELDGVLTITSAGAGGGSTLADANYGDVTATSGGTVITINNAVVTDAKINDVAWSKVTGRPTTIVGYGITDAFTSAPSNEVVYGTGTGLATSASFTANPANATTGFGATSYNFGDANTRGLRIDGDGALVPLNMAQTIGKRGFSYWAAGFFNTTIVGQTTANDGAFANGVGTISAVNFNIFNTQAYPIRFITSNTLQGQINANGNWLVGSATDTGERLQVTGTARATKLYIQAVSNSGTTYPIEFLNSAGNGVLFRVNELGATLTSNVSAGYFAMTDQIYIGAAATATRNTSYNSTGKQFLFNGDLRFANSTGNKSVFYFRAHYGSTGTWDLYDMFRINTDVESIGIAAGTRTTNIFNIDPTYNFTGGTSTVSGFYYNPTLTSMTGVTHYAINAMSGLIKVNSMATAAGVTEMVTVNEFGVFGKQAIPSGGGSTTLDGLTDVTITTPATGQVLKYNGSIWVNDTDATGGAALTAPTGRIVYGNTGGDGVTTNANFTFDETALIVNTGTNAGQMSLLGLRNTAHGTDSAVNSSLAITFTNRSVGGVWASDVIRNVVYANTAGAIRTGFEIHTHVNQDAASTTMALRIEGTDITATSLVGTGVRQVMADATGKMITRKRSSISVVSTSANVNPAIPNTTYLIDTTAAEVTVTINPTDLWDSVNNESQQVWIKKTVNSANVINVIASTGNIDGGAEIEVIGLNESICVFTDGTNLYVK